MARCPGGICTVTYKGWRIGCCWRWTGSIYAVNGGRGASPNLHHYDGIVPCGIREHGVTSLHELGLTATIEDVDVALMASWPGVFGGAADTHG